MTNPLSKQFVFKQLVYYDSDEAKFVGVCLDLNLLVESDSLESAVNLLNDAVVSHLLSAAEVGFPPELVFRPAPSSYWEIAKSFSSKLSQGKAHSAEEFALFTQNIGLPELRHAT